MIPLATKMRPENLTDFIGQEDLVGPNGPLLKLIESNKIPSMIFWGPAASGKTSLAKIISNTINADFYELSAVMNGKDDLKKILQIAKVNQVNSSQTILFIDEIHRWSKSQQDALLAQVESGQITLIGATTENPSFAIISPLLSRTRVFVFKTHTENDILKMLQKGLNFLKNEFKSRSPKTVISESLLENEAILSLAKNSNGDPRFALNSLEIAFQIANSKNEPTLKPVTLEIISTSIQKFLRYDKAGEEHYNIISAVHKSLRSSNSSAATYWVMRMLQAGDDPLYIARRLLRFASEDIGNAAPNALVLANAAFETCQKLGMPECQTVLIQLADYLARAPKNNKVYVAVEKAKKDIELYGNLDVPMHFRNAPTKLMKNLGYGNGYEYDHNLPDKKSEQDCFPPELKNRNYFD